MGLQASHQDVWLKKSGSFRGSPFLISRIKKNDLARSLLPAWRNLRVGGNLRLHSRMSIKNFLFWFGVCIVSLLVMVRPAAAVSWKYNSVGASFTTPALACASYAVPYNPVTGTGNSWTFLYATMVTASNYSCYYNNYLGVPTGAFGAAVDVAAVVCPVAGTVFTTGFYDIGTDPNSNYGAPPLITCDNSCPNGYNGSAVSKRALVNGVYHYFAQGSYVSTASASQLTCSSGTASPSAITAVPAATCNTGQSSISMGGVTKCFDSVSGLVVNGNSASAVAAAKTLADAAAAQKIADAAVLAGNAGLSASGVADAKAIAAGVGAVGTIGGTTTTGFAPDDPMNAFCVDNPQASICKEQTAGKTTVSTAALSGLYTVGTLNNSKTFGGVVGDFKTRFLASGIGAGAGGFFNVTATAGACPTWSSDVPMFGTMTFDFYCGSTFQNLLPWMRAVILIIFSVVAFRIGFL